MFNVYDFNDFCNMQKDLINSEAREKFNKYLGSHKQKQNKLKNKINNKKKRN